MTRSRRHRNAPRVRGGAAGFTLLEVLVAIAIFAMAVGVYASTYLNILRAMEGVTVNQGLEQDMAAIRRQALLIADPEQLEEGGDLLTGQHGLATWDIEYEPTEVADLFRVTLSVRLDPEDQEKGVREAQQTFYLTRPTWSEPVERDTLREATRQRLFADQQAGGLR